MASYGELLFNLFWATCTAGLLCLPIFVVVQSVSLILGARESGPVIAGATAVLVTLIVWDTVPNYFVWRSAVLRDGGLRISKAIEPQGLYVGEYQPGWAGRYSRIPALERVARGDLPYIELQTGMSDKRFWQIRRGQRGTNLCLPLGRLEECDFRLRGWLSDETCLTRTETTTNVALYVEKEEAIEECKTPWMYCMKGRRKVLEDRLTGETVASMTTYSAETKLSRWISMGKGCSICFTYPQEFVYEDWLLAERVFGNRKVQQLYTPDVRAEAACISGKSPYSEVLRQPGESIYDIRPQATPQPASSPP